MIDEKVLIAEINKRIKALKNKKKELPSDAWDWSINAEINDYKSLLSFIGSLQEEPVSEELEEEIKRYTKPLNPEDIQHAPFGSLEKCARHFANWQKKQMMKGAIDAKVGFRFHRLSIDLKDNGIECLENGDNVKILIIKKEDN